jgi:DNA polymerase-4
VAARSEADLVAMLGRAAGRYLHAVAGCREPPPLQRRRGRRSFGAQRALRAGVRTQSELDAALADLGERVAGRMRRKGRTGRTVILRLRFGDYTRLTRSCTLVRATAEAASIAAGAQGLLQRVMPLVEAKGITLVGLAVTNLAAHGAKGQLALPLFDEEAGEAGPGR